MADTVEGVTQKIAEFEEKANKLEGNIARVKLLPKDHPDRQELVLLRQELVALRQELVELRKEKNLRLAEGVAGAAGAAGTGDAGPGPSSTGAAVHGVAPTALGFAGKLENIQQLLNEMYGSQAALQAQVAALAESKGTLGTISYEQYFKQQERALAVTTVDALFHLILPGVTPRLLPISEAEATSSLPGKSEPEEAMQTAFKGFLEAAVAQNDANYVVHDTHKNKYLAGTAPDITLVQPGHKVDGFNAMMLFELQRHELDNKHRGKAVWYCAQLLQSNAKRNCAICILSNCEECEVYMLIRASNATGFTMHGTGCVELLKIWPWVCALLSHDANALGLTVPRIDLRNGEVLYPSMLLGTGRGAQVYEVMRGGKRMACKVMEHWRVPAWRVELAVLQAIKLNPMDGLPMLEYACPELPDSTLLPSAFPLVLLTQPVVEPLTRLTYQHLRGYMALLSHLHLELKIVHRDIEPKHLAVMHEGYRPSVLDFGSAAPLDSSNPLQLPSGVDAPEVAASSDAAMYKGTILFASDDVLLELEHSPICQPHPRQDLVAFVKSVCALTCPPLLEQLRVLASNVNKYLSAMPRNQSNVAQAVKLVRRFWDATLSDNTPGGAHWASLVRDAYACEAGGEAYKEALQSLEERLACLLGPPVPNVLAILPPPPS